MKHNVLLDGKINRWESMCTVIISFTNKHIRRLSPSFESICIFKSRWLVRLINCVKLSRLHICISVADVLTINWKQHLTASTNCYEAAPVIVPPEVMLTGSSWIYIFFGVFWFFFSFLGGWGHCLLSLNKATIWKKVVGGIRCKALAELLGLSSDNQSCCSKYECITHAHSV